MQYIYQLLILGLFMSSQNIFAQNILQEKFDITFQAGATSIPSSQIDTIFEAIDESVHQVGERLISISISGKTSLENSNLYRSRLAFLEKQLIEKNINSPFIFTERYGRKEGNIHQLSITLEYRAIEKKELKAITIQLDSSNKGTFIFETNQNIVIKSINNTIIRLNTKHIKNAVKGEPISIKINEYLSPQSISKAQIRTSLSKKIARVGSIVFIKLHTSRFIVELDGCVSVSFKSPKIENATPIYTRQSKMFKKKLNKLNWSKVRQSMKPTTEGYQIKFCGKIMGYLGVSAGEITKSIHLVNLKGIEKRYSNINAFCIYPDSTIARIDSYDRNGLPSYLPLFNRMKTAQIIGSYKSVNRYDFYKKKKDWHQYRLNEAVTFSFNKKGKLENTKALKKLTFRITSYAPVVYKYFEIPWWKKRYL